MGTLLKRAALIWGAKELVQRIEQARRPKRRTNAFVRYGLPALAASAVVGGVAYLATTGRLKPIVEAGKGVMGAAKDEAKEAGGGS